MFEKSFRKLSKIFSTFLSKSWTLSSIFSGSALNFWETSILPVSLLKLILKFFLICYSCSYWQIWCISPWISKLFMKAFFFSIKLLYNSNILSSIIWFSLEVITFVSWSFSRMMIFYLASVVSKTKSSLHLWWISLIQTIHALGVFLQFLSRHIYKRGLLCD